LTGIEGLTPAIARSSVAMVDRAAASALRDVNAALDVGTAFGEQFDRGVLSAAPSSVRAAQWLMDQTVRAADGALGKAQARLTGMAEVFSLKTALREAGAEASAEARAQARDLADAARQGARDAAEEQADAAIGAFRDAAGRAHDAIGRIVERDPWWVPDPSATDPASLAAAIEAQLAALGPIDPPTMAETAAPDQGALVDAWLAQAQAAEEARSRQAAAGDAAYAAQADAADALAQTQADAAAEDQAQQQQQALDRQRLVVAAAEVADAERSVAAARRDVATAGSREEQGRARAILAQEQARLGLLQNLKVAQQGVVHATSQASREIANLKVDAIVAQVERLQQVDAGGVFADSLAVGMERAVQVAQQKTDRIQARMDRFANRAEVTGAATGGNYVAGMASGMESKAGIAEKAAAAVGTDAASAMSGALGNAKQTVGKDAAALGTTGGTGLATGMRSTEPTVRRAADAAGETAVTAMRDRLGDLNATIRERVGGANGQVAASLGNLGANIANGINQNLRSDAFDNNINQALRQVGTINGTADGAAIGRSVTAGMGSSVSPSALTSGVSAAVTAAGQVNAAPKGASIGGGFATGMAQGIDNGTSAVAAAVIRIVEAAIATARKRSNSASPSRVFADEVGATWAQGMGIGAEAETPFVEGKVRALVDAATAAANAAGPEIGVGVSGAAAGSGAAGLGAAGPAAPRGETVTIYQRNEIRGASFDSAEDWYETFGRRTVRRDLAQRRGR